MVRNETRFYFRRNSSKQKFYYRKYSLKQHETKFLFEIFQNFFIVTRLCHCPPSKIHWTMVNSHLVCLMRVCVKQVFTRAEPNFSGFGFKRITKQNKNSSLRKLIQNKAKLKQSNFASKPNETKFRNIFEVFSLRTPLDSNSSASKPKSSRFV